MGNIREERKKFRKRQNRFFLLIGLGVISTCIASVIFLSNLRPPEEKSEAPSQATSTEDVVSLQPTASATATIPIAPTNSPALPTHTPTATPEPSPFDAHPDWAPGTEVKIEFHSAGILENGLMMITFSTQVDELPQGDYFGAFTQEGHTKSVKCEIRSSIPNFILCYGELVGTGTPLEANIFYQSDNSTSNEAIQINEEAISWVTPRID